jgi:hypothetical protein
MMSLLRKYKKILVLFFAALMSVIFFNTVFAQQPQVAKIALNDNAPVAISLPHVRSDDGFAASHLEQNFYQ